MEYILWDIQFVVVEEELPTGHGYVNWDGQGMNQNENGDRLQMWVSKQTKKKR